MTDVIDLGDVKKRADERDALAKEQAEQARIADAQQRAAIWDRRMRNAFKGIVPRPRARKQLERAMEVMDDDA